MIKLKNGTRGGNTQLKNKEEVEGEKKKKMERESMKWGGKK